MKIGIDIGGSHVAVGLINQTGKIVCKSEKNIANKLEEKDFAKILINTIIEQIQNVLEEGKKDITQVSLIGIAVPGMVSKTSIIKAENLQECIMTIFNTIMPWRILYEIRKPYAAKRTASVYLSL